METLSILQDEKTNVKSVSLHFDLVPLAVQSVRFRNAGKFIQTYQPSKNHEYKSCIRTLAMNQLPSDFEMFTGTLFISVDFVFPALKSFTKATQRQIETGSILHKSTKPDLHDNLCKSTFDALTNLVWQDDSQIAELYSRKIYGLAPCITMNIKEI